MVSIIAALAFDDPAAELLRKVRARSAELPILGLGAACRRVRNDALRSPAAACGPKRRGRNCAHAAQSLMRSVSARTPAQRAGRRIAARAQVRIVGRCAKRFAQLAASLGQGVLTADLPMAMPARRACIVRGGAPLGAWPEVGMIGLVMGERGLGDQRQGGRKNKNTHSNPHTCFELS